MILVPNSESLREYNHCHGPDGKFCSEGSPEFQRWFAGSKVVDDAGLPLRVFHGTSAYKDFDTFKKGSGHGTLGPGIYFTNDPDYAASYANKGGTMGRLIPAYLRMRNPVILTSHDGIDDLLMAIYGRASVLARRRRSQANDNYIIKRADLQKLQDRGYDGIIWKHPGGQHIYLVFEPQQVKSALGNRGTYDPRSTKFTEYNRCHDPKDGKFASPVDTPCGDPGDLQTHVRRDLPILTAKEYYDEKKEGLYPHTEKFYNAKTQAWVEDLKWYDLKTRDGKWVQLKGRVLSDEALHGKLLYHVTGALDQVLKSGKLIAFADGGGLGGGQHAAVSFTGDRKAALNILDVMTKAQQVVADADVADDNEDAVARFELMLRTWAGRELHVLARTKYPPVKGDGPLDAVPMDNREHIERGITDAVQMYRDNMPAVARHGYERASMALDSFKLWLNYRQSAELGQNPILFARPENLRGKQFGLLAVPTRNLPKQTMVNMGADKFQNEIEVHGDVPITGAYYLQRRRR